jgi:hypothetical protein
MNPKALTIVMACLVGAMAAAGVGCTCGKTREEATTNPPAAPTLEEKAAGLLAEARQLHKDNKLDESLAKCNEVISSYPETPQATEAGELKKQIEMERKPAAVIPTYPYDPTREQLEAAYKAMKTEAIPTLAPVFKEYLFAMYNRDFEKAYNCLSSASHVTMLNFTSRQLTSDKLVIGMWEKRLEDPNITADERKVVETEIAKMREYIAGREACNGDGAKMYGYITDYVAKGNNHNPIHGYVFGPPLVFVKEVFQGDIGYALTTDPPGSNKMYFVKDNGAWKIDLTGGVKIADENDPAPQPRPQIPLQPAPEG